MTAFFVLYKDEFGEEHIDKFYDYGVARRFFLEPQNNETMIALLSECELWRYATTILHL